MSRITLKLLYPRSLKAVHVLPALFVIGLAVLIAMSIVVSPWFLAPIAALVAMIFVSALISTKSFVVAVKAVPASFIQLIGYGTGFIRAFFSKIILGRRRDINREIAIRKGK